MSVLSRSGHMDDLVTLALDIGFTRAAPLNISALRALPEVRAMCESDRCRRFGRSWSCPPGCGTLDECAERMRGYSGGVIVQTTASLEDEFDLETMGKAQELHKSRFLTLARQARLLYPDCLPLTAGSCTICRKCTYPEKPCRFPERMLSSMEAYGLLVSDVCRDSGLEYYYGPLTLTYSASILTKEANSHDT